MIFYNVKLLHSNRMVVLSNFSKLKNTSTNSSKSYSEINRIISRHSEYSNFSNAKSKNGFKNYNIIGCGYGILFPKLFWPTARK